MTLEISNLYFLAKDSVVEDTSHLPKHFQKYAGRKGFTLAISKDLIEKVEAWLIKNCIVLQSRTLKDKVPQAPYMTSNNSWCDYGYGEVWGAEYFFLPTNEAIEEDLAKKVNCKSAYSEWTFATDREFSYLKRNIWHDEYLAK